MTEGRSGNGKGKKKRVASHYTRTGRHPSAAPFAEWKWIPYCRSRSRWCIWLTAVDPEEREKAYTGEGSRSAWASLHAPRGPSNFTNAGGRGTQRHGLNKSEERRKKKRRKAGGGPTTLGSKERRSISDSSSHCPAPSIVDSIFNAVRRAHRAGEEKGKDACT